jgi:hypothetical protein
VSLSLVVAASGSTAGAASECTERVRSPRVMYRGDLLELKYRVCESGTVRFWLVGLKSSGRRGGAHHRRTFRVSEDQVGSWQMATLSPGAIFPGVYRVTMRVNARPKRRAPGTLTIKRRPTR